MVIAVFPSESPSQRINSKWLSPKAIETELNRMSSDANPSLGSSFPLRSSDSPQTNQTEPSGSFQQRSIPFIKPAINAKPREAMPALSAASVTMPARFAAAPTADENLTVKVPTPIATWSRQVQSQLKHVLADQVTPLRLAGHLSVLIVGAVILILSQVKLPEWNISITALPNDALGAVETVANNSVGASVAQANPSNEALQAPAAPFTVVEKVTTELRQAIEVYTVTSGDTVLGIATKYGLQPETVMWANSDIEQNPDRLSIGDQVNILPVDGVLHVVKPGDTLASLASKYKVDLDKITGYSSNNLADSATALSIGNQIIIPGGTKDFVLPQVPSEAYSGPVPSGAQGSGSFSWPTSGNISQGFWPGHRALDIGSWVGAPVKSADSGYVILAGGGWNGGYGNHVIIDHGNGYTTLYAHLSSIYVRPGESVSRGEQIGAVGSTGNSTGPHLHFEIRYQGTPRNPYNWLP